MMTPSTLSLISSLSVSSSFFSKSVVATPHCPARSALCRSVKGHRAIDASMSSEQTASSAPADADASVAAAAAAPASTPAATSSVNPASHGRANPAATATTPSPQAEDRNPLSPGNLSRLFISTEEFVRGLQDDGKMSKRNIMQYPKCKKLALELYAHWKTTGLMNLGANKSRDGAVILSKIIQQRKHIDKIGVLPQLLPFAGDWDSDKMYLISNDETGGQRALISLCAAHYGMQQKKQESQRTPSLAICVVYCLCHPSLRKAAIFYLANRKNRGAMDQSIPSEIGFGELVLALFQQSDLDIPWPSVMDTDNHDPGLTIDPSDCNYQDRDVAWILGTWTEYVKPKYKKVLTNWFKETGNGNRRLDNFINYTHKASGNGEPVPWLVWLYAIYMQSHFILASVSKGQPPEFVCKEAGFESIAAALGLEAGSDDDAASSSYKTPRKRETDELGKEIQESRAKLLHPSFPRRPIPFKPS